MTLMYGWISCCDPATVSLSLIYLHVSVLPLKFTVSEEVEAGGQRLCEDILYWFLTQLLQLCLVMSASCAFAPMFALKAQWPSSPSSPLLFSDAWWTPAQACVPALLPTPVPQLQHLLGTSPEPRHGKQQRPSNQKVRPSAQLLKVKNKTKNNQDPTQKILNSVWFACPTQWPHDNSLWVGCLIDSLGFVVDDCAFNGLSVLHWFRVITSPPNDC